jgi:hypothetical protein
MRTRYGVRKILPTDDYAATELVVLTIRELLYERAATERVQWDTFRVDVEANEHIVLYARVDVDTDDDDEDD